MFSQFLFRDPCTSKVSSGFLKGGVFFIGDRHWAGIIIIIYFLIKQFGSSKTFSLLKGSMGRFNDFLSRCQEDVIVLAHTHTWKEDEIKGTKNGDSIYVNTGTWIDFAHDVSTLTPSLCSVDRKKNFSLSLICAAFPTPSRERGTSAGSFPEQRLLPWPYLIKYNIQRL